MVVVPDSTVSCFIGLPFYRVAALPFYRFDRFDRFEGFRFTGLELRPFRKNCVEALSASQPRFRNPHRALWPPRVVKLRCERTCVANPLCCLGSVPVSRLAAMRRESASRRLRSKRCVVRCALGQGPPEYGRTCDCNMVKPCL